MISAIRGFSLLAVLVASLALAASAAAQPSTTPPWDQPLPSGRQVATMTVGDETLTVDLALTSPEQQLGLGYRNALAPRDGMLFVFDQPSLQTFWMKGMRFCLDIIWINDDVVQGAAKNACPDPAGTQDIDRARYPSNVPAQYVLEVPGGWMDAHGVEAGTPVELPTIP